MISPSVLHYPDKVRVLINTIIETDLRLGHPTFENKSWLHKLQINYQQLTKTLVDSTVEQYSTDCYFSLWIDKDLDMFKPVIVLACIATLSACSSTQKVAQFTPIGKQKEGYTLEQVKAVCEGKAAAEMEGAGREYTYGGLAGAIAKGNAREAKYNAVMKSCAAEHGFAISYIEVPK
jgi:hypothetical protein